MIKLKRLTSYIIVFTMLMSCIYQINASGAENVYSNTELTAFNENVELFKALGVITDDTSQEASTTLTRGKFIKILIRLLDGGNISPEKEDYYMSEAVNRGIINKAVNDDYRPNDFITFEEVVKCMVEALGYSIYIENKEYSFSDYLYAANRAGFLNDNSKSASVYMTYIDITRLLEECLKVPLMVQVKYSTDEPQYSVEDGQTILSGIFKLEERKGVVTSTSKSPLFKQNKARVGSVGIDNVEYETKINCDEFLGMTVGYYISTKTDEIAFVGKETRYNKTLVLKDNQIEQFANQVYTYRKEDGGIRIKAVLATPCYVNYNGLVAYDFDMSNMIPKIGEVRLVDNNLDGKYDVSFIINNEIKVIQMVDEAKKTMFFRDGTNVKLTDGEYKICNHGGKDLALSNFVPGDIVYYSASENSKFVYIGIIRKKISGKPKYYSKDENSGRITVEIDGKRYESVNGFYKNTEVTVNRSYVFYFDNEEKIVAILSGIESDVYGYLVQAQILERDELHMKVYSQNNTMQILKVAKRVLVDGVQRKDAKTIKADLNKGAREDQIIKYSLNNEGEISKIDTAYNLNANYQTTLPTDKEDKNSLRVEYSSTLNNEGALSYRSGMKSLGGKVSVDSGTIIFQVPKVLNGADDKDFIVGSMSNLVNEDSYSIDSYSDSEVNAVAKVMVAYGEGFGDKKDYIGVLMSEASVLTEQGEGTKLVFSGPPGVEMSAINYDMDLEKVPGYWGATGIFKADVGDIVRAYIVNGELKLIQMVYDYENEKVIPCPSERAFGGMQRYEFGSVYSKLGEYISITSKNLLINGSEITSADLQYYNISQFKMIKVDKDDQGTIEAYETTDDLIMDYKSNVSVFSKVFVYSSYGSPWLIVVYD